MLAPALNFGGAADIPDPASSITVNTAAKAAPNFPPPKTDKPRPHVCATCQRSFARLEHLKRHERSHTKEKPFECPECARCFARRDLLLRHQQKLHQTSTPSSRPRNRRESTTGTPAQSRARKNSVANAAGSNGSAASMRPRANTISHVDQTAMQMIAAANASVAPPRVPQAHHGHNRHPSLAGLPIHGFDHTFGGMATAMNHRGSHHGLKIETAQNNSNDFSNGLRTAPPMAALNPDFDLETLMFGSAMSASTINPNALHYNDTSPPSLGMDHTSPFGPSLGDMPSSHSLDDDFAWLTGFENTMSFQNENVVLDESSPSAISTTSQSGISDVMLDGSNHKAPAGTSAMWQSSLMGPPQMPNPFALDLSGSVFPDLLNGAPLSPQPASQKTTNDPYLSTPPPSMSSVSPSAVSALNTQNINQTLGFSAGPETPPSLSGGNHGASPVTTITDATRATIVNALSQGIPYGTRRYSFTSQGSPQSPGYQSGSSQETEVPSTQDLQRFVGAYLTYFHPHRPFLHIPTLSFDPHASQNGRTNGVGGSGCLILSMAAIGALYELEHKQSREIFEMAKKMIFYYLEERRKADVRRADMRRSTMGTDYSGQSQESPSHTPVWLVQAMLLNVVYGHNCGDKTAGDIASTHCAALVSLAHAADLLKPVQMGHANGQDTLMTDDGAWNIKTEQEEQLEWLRWKTMEERKRTLFCVFTMSSLLVSAYNHTPALTNSEIFLDLPSDEEFFSAESSTAFAAIGGATAANHNRISFHDALGELLRTNERQHHHQQQQMPAANGRQQGFGFAFEAEELPQTDLKPSTFGCLVLINALHNYIWETRQRHHQKVWTNEETEKMHRHIEPALKAWQAAWASNPKHMLERPNPFGLGPLSADCIPLLDLAYIRLFVNMARSKEKFWLRDWDGMAQEMAHGLEVTQNAEQDPSSMESTGTNRSENSSTGEGLAQDQQNNGGSPSSSTASRRERHLRKAAFFAADSLTMWDKLDLTFGDCTDRDLPLQSAMCLFDCAQVLAEWVATLQDRVGGYLGILGHDEVDYTQVPAIMLLEDEDVKLLKRIEELLASVELQRKLEATGGNLDGAGGEWTPSMDGHGGFATKVLRIAAYRLGKAAVWPVTHLTAKCLDSQATYAKVRAEQSTANGS